MITTLILIILILAAFSLLWWAVNALALPQQVKVVVLVILGLLALVVIWNFVQSGSPRLSLR